MLVSVDLHALRNTAINSKMMKDFKDLFMVFKMLNV